MRGGKTGFVNKDLIKETRVFYGTEKLIKVPLERLNENQNESNENADKNEPVAPLQTNETVEISSSLPDINDLKSSVETGSFPGVSGEMINEKSPQYEEIDGTTIYYNDYMEESKDFKPSSTLPVDANTKTVEASSTTSSTPESTTETPKADVKKEVLSEENDDDEDEDDYDDGEDEEDEEEDSENESASEETTTESSVLNTAVPIVEDQKIVNSAEVPDIASKENNSELNSGEVPIAEVPTMEVPTTEVPISVNELPGVDTEKAPEDDSGSGWNFFSKVVEAMVDDEEPNSGNAENPSSDDKKEEAFKRCCRTPKQY